MTVRNLIPLLTALVCACIVRFAPAEEPWLRHTIDDSSRGADGVRLADVNGDGLPDIATGWEEGGVIRVCINPGPKSAAKPWPAVTVGKVKSPEDAVLVDLDSDGAMDVVSCCEGKTRTVYVHWAPNEKEKNLDPAAWTTEPFPATANKQMWMYCLPMQIDGQYGVDLIVGAKGGGASVGWLQAPADPRNLSGWTYHELCPAGWIMSLIASDVDKDGDADVVVSDRKGANRGVFWLQNPGPQAVSGGAAWQRHAIGAKGREIMFLDVADIDGQSPVAVAAAVKATDVWTFAAPSPLTATAWKSRSYTLAAETIGTAKAVRVADINADGRLDAVCSCEHATAPKSGVFWFTLAERDAAIGSPPALHDISGPRGVKFDLIELVDLDKDGDLDVITCEERDNLGVVWYENPNISSRR